jgi:hypothetical protein
VFIFSWPLEAFKPTQGHNQIILAPFANRELVCDDVLFKTKQQHLKKQRRAQAVAQTDEDAIRT